MQDERAEQILALLLNQRRASPLPSDAPERFRPQPDDAVRRSDDSHVRLRGAHGLRFPFANVEWLEAQELLDELREDQRTLRMRLASVALTVTGRPTTQACSEPFEGDGRMAWCSRKMGQLLSTRLEALDEMCDALADVQLAAVPPSVHPVLLPDAPLAEYLRGICAWMLAVVRALEELVAGLFAMQPDWVGYRWRIEEAKNFHFDELTHAIDGDFAALFEQAGAKEAVKELMTSFDVLAERARQLEAHLDECFY